MDQGFKSAEELNSELLILKNELSILKESFLNERKVREQFEFNLKERLKELKCHDQLSEILSNSTFSINEVASKIVQVIPSSLRFPESGEACIEIYDKAYKTVDFQKTDHCLNHSIKVNEQVIGQIEVCYLKGQISPESLVFSSEEKNLLFSIAVKLGNYIEKEEKKIALKESEEKYKDLVENINDVIFTIDSKGLITFISPSITRLLGYSTEELIGKNFSSFVGESEKSLHSRFLEIQTIGELQNEYQIHSKTGEPHWIRFSTKAIIKGNEFLGATGTLVDITEAKLNELKVQKSEEQYRKLVETVNDVIYEIDQNGLIKYASPSTFNVLGYRPEELTGRSIFSFIHPEDGPLVMDSLKNLLTRNYNFKEYRYIRKDGSVHWVRSSTSPILKDGIIIGGTGTLTDVTDRKSAEIALLESEEKFSKAFKTAPYAISITNSETGDFFEINDSFIAYTGYSKEEIYSDSSIGLKLWANIEDRNKVIADLKNGQEVLAREYSFVKKSGNIAPCIYSASLITLNNQSCILSSITDISETKQVELERRKLSRAVEQSPVSIVITNLEGNIEYANPKACETTGYTLDELIGKNPRVLKSGETPDTEYTYLWDTISHGNSWRGIFHNKRKNGEFYWESSQITPILDADGQIMNYLAIKEDITVQKKTQEALLESEKRFSQLAEQSKTVIWEVDAQGLYTYVGPLAEVIWGYSPEDLIGKKHFYDLHPIVGREEFKEKSLKFFNNQEAFYDYPNQIITGDNRCIWVSTNGIPMIDSQKNFIGYRGADNDITERVKAEEALKISEAALNQAQEISMMCSWELDMRTEELTWSKNYYNLMGVPVGTEIKTQYFKERVHPEDVHLVDEKLEEMKSTRKPVSYDLRLLMPDNQFRWIQNNIVPEFDDEKLIFLKGVNIDITEKKLSEENIRRQNERLSVIIEAMPDLIFITDKNGNYLEYYGSTPDKLVGPDDQIIGKNITNLFDEEIANLHLMKIDECLQTNSLVTYNFVNNSNNTSKCFEVRFAPLAAEKVLTFVRDITQEKRKDNELRKLSLGIEQSPVITIITDLQARIEYVNPAFEAITGYSAKEVNGRNVKLLQSGKTDKSVYQQLWDTLNQGKQWHGEWINKKKNGELFWEDVLILPIHDETGKATNYLAIKQDITQRKESQDILKQSEEKYRFMFSNNPQPMWIYDIETLQFLEVNRAAIDHYDYSRDEFLSMTIKDIRPSEFIADVINDVKQTRSDISYGQEWQHQKKNGEILNVEVASHSITYNGRKARHVLANDITMRKSVEKEITELNANLEKIIVERTSQLALTNADLQIEIDQRKRVQEALSASEKSYRTVVENVNEVIFQTDAEGLWIFLNKSWEEVTGFSVKESLGQLFVNYVHPEDRARNWELFEPLINRKKEYCRHEIRYLTKDGGYRWIEVFARLGINEKDEIIGTYGTLMDVTERRQVEESLKQISTRLTLALRAGGIGVWDYDIDNDILYWDHQMLSIYGIKEEDFIGAYDTWQNGLHPDDKVRCNEEIKRAIIGEKEFDTEFRVVWLDGSVHYVRALGTVQRDESGHALHMIGTNWDITVQKKAADFESELLQLSPKLTGVSLHEIKAALQLALSRIGQFLCADRAYIFEFNHEGATMSNTIEWCNEGISPEMENLQDIPCDLLPKWMEAINNRQNILIPSVKDLPESWKTEREILEPQGIQSLIVIPMLVENTIIGFVGLDSVVNKKEYNSSEINILKVWSSMLASLINNLRVVTLLEQTRQNFETFFNTIDDFLWVLDDNGKIIHINNTVKTRLEYSDEELYNESVLLVHPSDRREEAGRIVQEMLVGKVEFCPVPVVTKSGKQIPVETRVQTGFWNGNPVIFGVSKDISQIRLSEQKFASAFQFSSALMSISNFDNGKYIEVNGAFIETLGYTRDELIGRTNAELGIFTDPTVRDKILNKLNQGISVQKLEVHARTKHGQFRTGILSAESILVGEERCLLVVVMDITELKQAEEELHKARIEAEKANVAKSEFLSRMSHELRTPMNSILGFAQLLEMGDLDARQKKGVTHIMHSGKHLLDLINEVLDISRIESGRLSLSLEPVQLSGIVQEMMDVIKPQSEALELKVEFVSSPINQLFVKSDRQRLKQVLLNLLNNAIKYNNTGGSITIKAEMLPEDRDQELAIRISISDTGLGISAEDLPKLFNPFERIGAEKSSIEGTGLGLTVVKKLMSAMGGENRRGKCSRQRKYILD